MGSSPLLCRFIVQYHKSGRSHFDLRVHVDGAMRSWSLLKEPPSRPGQKRLAIEREALTPEEASRGVVTEQAFGSGRVQTWDEGEVEMAPRAGGMDMQFRGQRLRGRYQMRRMKWYPGNRWLLSKTAVEAS